MTKDINAKYAKKRRFLEDGLKQAEFEEQIHLKQEKYNRYERLFEKYAFPIGEYRLDTTRIGRVTI
jgi:oxalate decarboxylase/phosphoglucose isomerase-like protein (cupin superfamily)